MLDAVPDGYGALRLAIMEGRIDPVFPNVTQVIRQGCLRAHLAAYRGCDSWALPGAAKLVLYKTGQKYVEQPAEVYIEHVRYGHKPSNCQELKTLIGYMDEWLSLQSQRQACVVDEAEFVMEFATEAATLVSDEEFV